MPVTPQSVLPPSLTAKLNSVGERLDRQLPIGQAFDGLVAEMNAVRPSVIVRADSEIANAANLQKWRRQFPLIVSLFAPRTVDMDQLGHIEGLEYLFLFHRDGYIREAALRRIHSALPSAFFFSAIAWRLNDWVHPVRAAAAECANRCFPITAPEVIAEAALTLLARENSWGRWSEERGALAKAFARSDVAECLAAAIQTRRTGPMATVLRYALREPNLDCHLEMLARDAVQPAVRATASQALIDGCATWPDGWDWHWVNKPMGIRRRQTTYRERPLKHTVERIPLIEASARDPSAIVRRIAASSIIRYTIETDLAKAIARPLLQDRSPSVRERAEFIFKRIAEAQTD
jgi:hypothetical protein